jgi:hypothetical protein
MANTLYVLSRGSRACLTTLHALATMRKAGVSDRKDTTELKDS